MAVVLVHRSTLARLLDLRTLGKPEGVPTSYTHHHCHPVIAEVGLTPRASAGPGVRPVLVHILAPSGGFWFTPISSDG